MIHFGSQISIDEICDNPFLQAVFNDPHSRCSRVSLKYSDSVAIATPSALVHCLDICDTEASVGLHSVLLVQGVCERAIISE